MPSSTGSTQYGPGAKTPWVDQQALAQAAAISVPYLSQIESGRRTGSAEVLASLARALGRSVDDLLTP